MKLSVIIPCYNAETTIRECLESVLENCPGDVEIVAIDDGSNDNTLNILTEYKDKKVIKLIHLTHTKGVSHARNLGISCAEGEYLLFVDSDDLLGRDFLQIAVRIADKQDIAIFKHKNFALEVDVYEMNEKIEDTKVALNKRTFISGVLGMRNDVPANVRCSSVWAKVIKKKVITDNNILFDENVRIGEDSLFLYEYANYCDSIIFYPLTAYYYRISASSLSHGFNPKMLEDDGKWQFAFEEIQKRIGRINNDELNFSAAKGLLNIFYLEVSHRANKNSPLTELCLLKTATEKEPYCVRDVGGAIEKFNRKQDRLLLFAILKKQYWVLYIIIKVKRLLS